MPAQYPNTIDVDNIFLEACLWLCGVLVWSPLVCHWTVATPDSG